MICGSLNIAQFKVFGSCSVGSCENSMTSKALLTRRRRSARIAAARSVATNSNEVDRYSRRKNAAASAKSSRVRILQSQQCYMLSLNDDCISKILSHLDLSDLFALNESCRQLSYLTYLAARKRFRQNDYMRLQIHKDIDAVLMLKKFGKFFTNLCIDFEHSFFDGFVASSRGGNWSLLRNGPDFDSMMRDCTSLKRLKFRKVDFKSFSIWKCRNILRNIETLEIEDCIGITQKIAHLLNVCKKMKHFTLGPTYHLQEPSDLFSSIVGFGQDVETIRLKIDSTYETALFLIFLKRLQRNKNLKTLELGLFWEYSMSTRVINALTTIDSLEELNLRRFIPNEDYFRALNRCKNLKVCKLHTNESVTDAMMGLASNFAFTSEKNESERCDEDLDYMETTPCPTIYTIVLIRKG